jgi:glycine betaine/proline transport system substrate-binding protein
LTLTDEGVEADQAAIWFLREKQDIWTTWVSDEIAEKVKQKL